MKQELRTAIGKRFGSVNSDAHITFNVFRCDETELALRIKAVQLFCGQVAHLPMRFNHFGNIRMELFSWRPMLTLPYI
ncbi:hypothetical protein [Flavobacterium selenitireducens]|uniref:hypothetical protein n=1 Tax=Flavobacterium selenitireducens TaxID=2722704 RepID=UPI00168AC7C9|nr:hypothetical protein [Flavobacterium selenitireducens]MBD3582890.1 hypothetical protein [Flavobacterium selenitireducens]